MSNEGFSRRFLEAEVAGGCVAVRMRSAQPVGGVFFFQLIFLPFEIGVKKMKLLQLIPPQPRARGAVLLQ